MEYLTRVMRGSDKAEIVLALGLAGGGSKAVRMKKKPDQREKLKAAELLGKNLGLFDKQADNNHESLEKLSELLKEIKDDAQQ